MSILINSILANWKTTGAALVMAVTAFIPVLKALTDGDPATIPNWNLFVPELIAAIGLLFARDSNKTSTQSGLK